MKNSLFLSRSKETSIALSLGCLLLFFQDSVICYIIEKFDFPVFYLYSPFGFLLDRAKSIPITHLSLNSNMRFQVYMRDLLFGYIISK